MSSEYLGINPNVMRNLESPRVPMLIPEQIRSDASQIISLLQEYYNYLNTTGLPSSVISETLSENDIDQVSATFLGNLQNAIAIYVPNPPRATYYSRVNLYKKIVKYYYSTRGSRNSAYVFFQLFFETIIEIIDNNNGDITQQVATWVGNSGQLSVDAWLPYSYVIASDIAASSYDSSYQALVHPVGFKYLALLRLILFAANPWNDAFGSLSWNYSYLSSSSGIVLGSTIPVSPSNVLAPVYQSFVTTTPVNGSITIQYVQSAHSPTIQPNTIIAGVRITYYTYLIITTTAGRMADARYDYQSMLKFLDVARIAEYGNYIISEAGGAYNPGGFIYWFCR